MPKSKSSRQLIVERAAAIFNSKGYAGTSMGDIVAATGLSKGGVYGNFSSKEEIAIAAFDHAVAQVYEQIGTRTSVIEHSLDKLKAVVYFYKEHILNPPVAGGCPLQNTAVEADDTQPALRERVMEAMDEWQSRIIHTVDKGKERGEVKPEADSAAFALQFIGTLEGGVMLAQLYKDVAYFNTMAALLLQMIEQLRVENQNAPHV